MTIKYPDSPLTAEDLHLIFDRFGDIKDIRVFKGTDNQRFIEYFDSRACIAAFEEMNGKMVKGGTAEIKLAFDRSLRQRMATAEYAEETKVGGKFHVATNRRKRSLQVCNHYKYFHLMNAPISCRMSLVMNSFIQSALQHMLLFVQSPNRPKVPI